MNYNELDLERAAELDGLLDTALDLPPEARAAWLDALDARYDSLKPRLRDLLARAADVQTRDFLSTLPKVGADGPDDAAERRSTAAVGETVGPYRLVRELGSGGMASVWLAERIDGLIKRPVALKLPHAALHRAGLVERMVREREVLATLEHPNIARLYDAGVSDEGQPYLALEYVAGREIDTYCREHALGLEARIDLFLQAARAVAYAHGKLVIHRDLKPANILVTGDGTVKLLDFGIAKLLEDRDAERTQLTELFGRALTPDYASPEQIRGQHLTVASDVYTLGVLLCWLLAEQLPYRPKRSSRAALEEAILHDEPLWPSELAAPALRRALRGDLDTVVLKALRKAPEARYATVHALVDDLERYRTGRPVAARPDSSWYRARKFVARNRVAVGASAAVAAAVLLGAGTALWQARVAVAERDRAEEVKEFIASIFREADPYAAAGRALSGAELLNAARAGIADRFGDRPEIRIELLTTVGSSLTNLGDLRAAEAVLEQAIADAAALYGPSDTTTLRSRVLLAEVHNVQRDADTLRAEIAELMPLVRAQAAEDPETLIRLLKIDVDLKFLAGHYDDIAAPAREAFELAEGTLGERHPLTVTMSSLLAESFLFAGDIEQILPQTERALALALAAHGGRSEHPQVIYMRDVRSRGLAVVGDFHGAIAEMDAAIRAADLAFGPGSSMAAYAMINIAPYDRRVGALRTSIERSNRALETFGKNLDPKSADVAYALTTRGVTFLAARDAAAALADLAAAEDIYRELFGEEHWDTITVRLNRAIALAYLGRFAEAEEALAPVRAPGFTPTSPLQVLHSEGIVARVAGDAARAVAKQREAQSLIEPGPRSSWEEARVLAELGPALLANNAVEAQPTLGRARELFVELAVQMHPAYADVLLALGRDEASRGAFDRALPFVIQADAFWREFDPDNHFAGEAAFWLARCYTELGRTAEAAVEFDRARRVLSTSAGALAGPLLAAIPTQAQPSGQ